MVSTLVLTKPLIFFFSQVPNQVPQVALLRLGTKTSQKPLPAAISHTVFFKRIVQPGATGGGEVRPERKAVCLKIPMFLLHSD